jgi:hypothetical protein
MVVTIALLTKIKEVSFTPGFSRVTGSKEGGKPFKRFSDLSFARFTWLKPSVNEIALARKNPVA